MNCDVHGHVLRSYNLPVLYLYCNSFFIRDVHEEFGLINVHFLTFRLEKSGKSRQFFSVWGSDTPVQSPVTIVNILSSFLKDVTDFLAGFCWWQQIDVDQVVYSRAPAPAVISRLALNFKSEKQPLNCFGK